jgi:Glutaminase
MLAIILINTKNTKRKSMFKKQLSYTRVLAIAILSFSLITAVLQSCSRKAKDEIAPAPTVAQTGESAIMKVYSINMTEGGQAAEIGFIQSARMFTLRATEAGYTAKLDLLNKSKNENIPVTITFKKDADEISDVKETTPDQQAAYRSKLVSEEEAAQLDGRAITLTSVIPNMTTLTNLFNQIKAQSCGVSGAPSTCITFRYAADGCYARAHKMRQILAAAGYDCQKQFVYGNLYASTGTCCVRWGYHVAPLVKVINSSGVTVEYIIDPSIFPNGPVTPLTWRNATANRTCNSGAVWNSFITLSSWVYYYDPVTKQSLRDDLYSNTNCTLLSYKFYSGCSAAPFPNCP